MYECFLFYYDITLAVFLWEGEALLTFNQAESISYVIAQFASKVSILQFWNKMQISIGKTTKIKKNDLFWIEKINYRQHLKKIKKKLSKWCFLWDPPLLS